VLISAFLLRSAQAALYGEPVSGLDLMNDLLADGIDKPSRLSLKVCNEWDSSLDESGKPLRAKTCGPPLSGDALSSASRGRVHCPRGRRSFCPHSWLVTLRPSNAGTCPRTRLLGRQKHIV
jgi:hypothetical protein